MGELSSLLVPALNETIYMVVVSTLLTVILGMPLGVVLVVTADGHILPQSLLHKVLASLVNLARSLPFVILMIAIMPFTKLVVGTTIGTTAAMVPLIVAAVPFFARIVESALKDIDYGVIEAALAMGGSPWQIINQVMIPEAIPSLVLGITITLINILGYSAMAGVVGGGGLGDLAIRYGYHRFRTEVMISTVVVLVMIVQITQVVGSSLSSYLNKK